MSSITLAKLSDVEELRKEFADASDISQYIKLPNTLDAHKHITDETSFEKKSSYSVSTVGNIITIQCYALYIGELFKENGNVANIPMIINIPKGVITDGDNICGRAKFFTNKGREATAFINYSSSDNKTLLEVSVTNANDFLTDGTEYFYGQISYLKG